MQVHISSFGRFPYIFMFFFLSLVVETIIIRILNLKYDGYRMRKPPFATFLPYELLWT